MKRQAELFMCLGSLFVAIFMCATTAAAQERLAPEASALAQAGGAGGKAGAEGIQVHGHWMIEVRNSDGSISSHNEFENECYLCGSPLSLLLGWQSTRALAWSVTLAISQPLSVAHAPCLANGQQLTTTCTLIEDPLLQGTGTNLFPGLIRDTSDPVSAGGPPSKATLAGSFPAATDGTVDNVFTTLLVDTLQGRYATFFSRRNLVTPIQVVAGQTVYVKVTYSFS